MSPNKAIQVDIFGTTGLSRWVSMRFRYKNLADLLSGYEVNGPEFAGKVLDSWAWKNDVKLDFSRSGKLVDNVFIESFHRAVRNEA